MSTCYEPYVIGPLKFISHDQEDERVARKLFVALVLHEIINETPMDEVAVKYGMNRSMISRLQVCAWMCLPLSMACTPYFCLPHKATLKVILISDVQQPAPMNHYRSMLLFGLCCWCLSFFCNMLVHPWR